MWLVIGLILKLINFNFIFFVPAFVTISGYASAGDHALIAFAGPAVNLVLWAGAWTLLHFKKIPRRYYSVAVLTSRINMFLFIFNMIPIPMFDGYTVFTGLFHVLFG
jgi:Zn-dependent protease